MRHILTSPWIYLGVSRCRVPQPPRQSSPAWLPHHGMVTVGILGVTNPEGDPVTVRITSVFQDEPTNGLGDGDTGPDAILDGEWVDLRTERSGRGNGRVYHVTFTADDGQGGVSEGTVTVCVPQ